MSKKLYIGLYAASLGICLLTFLILSAVFIYGLAAKSHYAIEMAFSFSLNLGILAILQFLLVQTIYVFLMLAKMWGAIQDGQTEITVGKAIGFLFIPFFNIYWIFRAWGSFPAQYNAYVDRYQLPAPHLSGGIYTAYPILILLSALPFVGIVIAIIGTFVFLAIISKTCDAVNLLDATVQERHNNLSRALIQNQAATAF